jgi:hypothetical protein
LLSTLEQKMAFWRFISQNARETARFFAVFAILYGCEGLYDFYESSTTTPGPGTPHANSRRAKQFWGRPHGL